MQKSREIRNIKQIILFLLKPHKNVSKFLYFSVACVVLHNICVQVQEGDVPLPNSLGLMEFGSRMEETTFDTPVFGRPASQKDCLRKHVIENFMGQ